MSRLPAFALSIAFYVLSLVGALVGGPCDASAAQEPSSESLEIQLPPAIHCSIEVQLVQGWLEPLPFTIVTKRTASPDGLNSKIEGQATVLISDSIHKVSFEYANGVAQLDSSIATLDGIPKGYQFSTLGVASLVASKTMKLGDSVPISVTTLNIDVLKSQPRPKNYYSATEALRLEQDGVKTLRSNAFCMIRSLQSSRADTK